MNLAFRTATEGESDKPRLPGSLHLHRRLSQWLELRADGTVLVKPGKVELGQGILTALTQIVAEELDVDPSRIVLLPATTGESPDEAVTSGSLSVQECGMALRYAAAAARGICLMVVAQASGVPVEAIRIADGRFLGPDGTELGSYAALAGRGLLEVEAPPDAKPKPAAERRLAGSSLPRIDLPAKVFGQTRLIHDLRLPGMRHARVLHPPRLGARLEELQEGPLPPGVILVRDGSFLAVVASEEALAEAALARIARRARWSAMPPLPADTAAWLRDAAGEDSVVAERGEPSAAPTLVREFVRPYLQHASVGLCCAVAQWHDQGLTVYSHTQGPYNLRADLAKALQLEPERIRVIHMEGAGCYGHNGADDVALDAALAARALPGVPVRMLWTRAQELADAPASPAMWVRIEATTDAAGRLTHWRSRVHSNGHSGRPGRGAVPTLLSAPLIPGGRPIPPAINPPLAAGGGIERNAVPLYDVPNLHVAMRRVTEMPIRTSALRGLGALMHVWAIESVMDELAERAGMDPLAYRLAHLSDARARAVLETAAAMAGWSGRGPGLGLGLARYKNSGAWCAVIARIEAEERVRARELWLCADVGEVINPDGTLNQLEGGALHAVSIALHEALRHDGERVLTDSWAAYPVLRFPDVPRVTARLIPRPEEPPLGAGEASMGPTIAAIAGAIHSALGVRPCRLPFTPENL
ncbi:MAG: molybdopterin cofactor-binding domain-containing protein [Rhodovarius sp.]|nr:molybdopterin cofactor-binding domain-containing protein [Rhodovarius sp.]